MVTEEEQRLEEAANKQIKAMHEVLRDLKTKAGVDEYPMAFYWFPYVEPAVGARVDRGVRPCAEAEALRNLADHAKFEAAMMGACDGSMSAQRAACLEWLACGAEYQHMLRGGPKVSTGKLLEAQENLVKQIKFLMA